MMDITDGHLGAVDARPSRFNGVYVPHVSQNGDTIMCTKLKSISCESIYNQLCSNIGKDADAILAKDFNVVGIYSGNALQKSSNLDVSCANCFSVENNWEGATPKNIVSPMGGVISQNFGEDVFSGWSFTCNDVYYDAIRGFDRYSFYAPVIIQKGLNFFEGEYDPVIIGNVRSQLNQGAWLHELSYENDIPLKDYITKGVLHGFDIVDRSAVIPIYHCKNYRSCTNPDNKPIVDKMFIDEISAGKYVVVKEPPRCIHSIGALKKPDGSLRLITDCRLPLYQSINNYMSTTFKEFSYTTIDNVIDFLKPNSYMCTIDISSAYRSIPISADQWCYQGVEWVLDGEKIFLVDTNLSFGLRCAPYVFTQISNFITRCLMRRGFVQVVNYLDDFICIGQTLSECAEAQRALIRILRSLGFFVNFKKCTSPSTECLYLGIVFNTVTMSVSLPQVKLDKLLNEVNFFRDRSRA